jgi:beta-N-acetylhexosaminidase
MVLVCNNPAAAAQVLEELEDYDEPASHVRMLRMHGRSAVSRAQLHLDPLWQEALQVVANYDEDTSLPLL